MARTLFDSNIGDVSATNVTQLGVVIASNIVVTGNVAVSATVMTNNLSVSGTVAGPLSVSGTITAAGLVATGPQGIIEGWNASVGLTGTSNVFASAVLLTANNNVITSCTFTSGSPCSLPSVATWMGGDMIIFNKTTMTVGVWPQPNDIIDSTATGAVVLMDASKAVIFYAVGTTKILSAQLGTTTV